MKDTHALLSLLMVVMMMLVGSLAFSEPATPGEDLTPAEPDVVVTIEEHPEAQDAPNEVASSETEPIVIAAIQMDLFGVRGDP